MSYTKQGCVERGCDVAFCVIARPWCSPQEMGRKEGRPLSRVHSMPPELFQVGATRGLCTFLEIDSRVFVDLSVSLRSLIEVEMLFCIDFRLRVDSFHCTVPRVSRDLVVRPEVMCVIWLMESGWVENKISGHAQNQMRWLCAEAEYKTSFRARSALILILRWRCRIAAILIQGGVCCRAKCYTTFATSGRQVNIETIFLG